jgi:two-component system cell cycle response regulator
MPKGRILAVDDQRYFRELVEGLLAEEGFEAQTASSGEEALRLLDQSRFDVVLTDLVMPGMDGSELLHRVKQRDPEQDVVVVTGVVDVKTAVDAMKSGATDYLLKPFDRTTLANTLETILQQRRLRAEHARLLAENIEYMGERSLYERSVGFFTRLSVPALAEHLIEALCIETQAQSGVLWVVSDDAPHQLSLAAARGLVRVEEEPEVIDVGEIPLQLRDGTTHSVLLDAPGPGRDGRADLHLAFRREGRCVGHLRLADKLGGEAFDAIDQGCAEKLLRFAEIALANAIRFRDLERRSFEDAVTGAYIFQYLQDVARNEIEKANRFGRSFSLMKLGFDRLDELRRQHGESTLTQWVGEVVRQLRQLLRATDLIAVDTEGCLWALLPEADALGAAVMTQRAREALAGGPLFAGAGVTGPFLSAATYPADGTQLEGVIRVLEGRMTASRERQPQIASLERLTFGESLHELLRGGEPGGSETASQVVRFLLDEVGRRPGDRGLLFLSPGECLAEVVNDGLEGLRGISVRTEVAVIAAGDRPAQADPGVSWISPLRAPGVPPFLIHYGDGPAYALVREDGRRDQEARFFHSDDRALVEHLAFRLHRELSMPHDIQPTPHLEGGS